MQPAITVRVFISHSWMRSDAYEMLLLRLQQSMRLDLEDLSIPRTRALAYLSHGEQALVEEIELQEALLETVAEESSAVAGQLSSAECALQAAEAKIKDAYSAIDQEVASVRGELDHCETRRRKLVRLLTLEDHLDRARTRCQELIADGAGARELASQTAWISELEATLHARKAEEIEKELATIQTRMNSLQLSISSAETERAAAREQLEAAQEDERSLRRRLEALRSRLEGLQEEVNQRIRRMDRLRTAREPDYYNRHHHFEVLARVGKVSRRLQHLAPNLSLAIFNAIRRSDVFVLIAGMYDQYKEWMEFEFFAAADMGKPVIAVLPPGQTTMPREVSRYVAGEFFQFDSLDLPRRIEAVVQN